MLFKSENPVLGTSTQVQELSGFGAGNPVLNAYKPTTRQIVNYEFDGVRNAGALTGWLFVAPWKCQIVQAKAVAEVSATAAATLQCYVLPQASQPAAPSTGNAVFAAAQALSSNSFTANTVFAQALTTSSSFLTMNPGDALGFVISAAITAVVGGLVQLEIVQIG